MEVNPFEIHPSQRAAKSLFERRRQRAMELLQIVPFFDRSLLSLSNGETQRVQLARALCYPVRLLILDEPFIGLDTTNRNHLQLVLQRLMRAGVPLLILTTRPEDLPRKVSHIIELSGCRVADLGARKEYRIAKPSRASLKFGRAKLNLRDFSAGTPHSGVRPLIRLRNVSVRYGRSVILKKVNWTVRSGESWAVLGPNGSGKTTLLSLLLGDNPQAYANDVFVFGRKRGSGESIWELKERIGWVSPELHLHFNEAMTCAAVVGSGFHDSVGLFEPPTRVQQAAIAFWLEHFQLTPFAEAPLFGLSVGLQRMALLARALVKRPALLVLDEPCQSLDAPHRELIIRTVNELIASSTAAVLYVTHRADELPRSINRALQLSHGGTVRLLRFR
jgi:molybdate transport system ATP-binding protein